MEYKTTLLRRIAATLLTRKYAVFVGAGLSKSAGIPVANEIQDHILRRLGFGEEDLRIFFQAQLPFEAFFEVLLRTVDCRPLITIFNAKRPSRNHRLVARLTRCGLKIIATTNFDTLLEQALDSENVTYRIYSSDTDLSRIDWSSSEVKLIKLHGSITDPENLAVTIRRVAAQGLAAGRRQAITELFSRLKKGTLLVFGYSCSDRFDLSPAIRGVSSKEQQVIYVNHQSDGLKPSLRKITPHESQHPFAAYDTKVLDCNADNLVSALWEEAFAEGAPSVSAAGSEWQLQVDKWLVKLRRERGEAVLPYLAGLMHKAANNWMPSNRFLMIARRTDIPQAVRSTLHLAIGNNYRDLGERQKARAHCRAAVLIAQHQKQAIEEARALNSLGILEEDERQHDAAIAVYKKALNIVGRSKRAEYAELYGKTHGNIGIALKNKGGTHNLRQALRHHEKALKTARDLGDKRSEGRTLGNLGITYSNLGHKAKAHAFYRDARQVAEDLGDTLHVAIWLHNAGEDAIGIDDVEAARLLREAIRLFTLLGQNSFRQESESCLARATGSD